MNSTKFKRSLKRKKTTSVYLDEEQVRGLKLVSRWTMRPQADLIREGIDLVLKRHGQTATGQVTIFDELNSATKQPDNSI